MPKTKYPFGTSNNDINKIVGDLDEELKILGGTAKTMFQKLKTKIDYTKLFDNKKNQKEIYEKYYVRQQDYRKHQPEFEANADTFETPKITPKSDYEECYSIKTNYSDSFITPKPSQNELPKILPANEMGQKSHNHTEAIDSMVLNTELETNKQTLSENLKRYNAYRKRALNAFQQRKIFTINGDYDAIRQSLKYRGWIEKCHKYEHRDLQQLPYYILIRNAENGNECEQLILSQMVQCYPYNFIWNVNDRNYGTYFEKLIPFKNQIRRSDSFDFTTKEGFIACLENSHWYFIDDISEINYPKYFRLSDSIEYTEFLRSYRTTYCLSLLVYIVEESDVHANDINSIIEKQKNLNENPNQIDKSSLNVESIFNLHENKIKENEIFPLNEDTNKNESGDENTRNEENAAHQKEFVFSLNGKVPLKEINFALQRIRKEVLDKQHIDLDEKYLLIDDINDDKFRWEQFFESVNEITKGTEQFQISQADEFHEIIEKCRKCLKIAENYFPNCKSDGYKNLWLIKPCYVYRGNQMEILRDFDEIMRIISRQPSKRYIVEKYLERPLKIHNRTFFINQYMLLSITSDKFTIWSYKECFLKFEKSKNDLHPYGDSEQIPSYEMWDLNNFQDYLLKINKTNAWSDEIYPKIKKQLSLVVLSSLDDTELVPNTFELFGCIFLMDFEFNPILIEINDSPDLSKSTIVTERICPNLLEDMIKIVIDMPKNPNIPIGQFELVYEMNLTQIPIYIDEELFIEGKAMKINREDTKKFDRYIYYPSEDQETSNSNTPKEISRNASISDDGENEKYVSKTSLNKLTKKSSTINLKLKLNERINEESNESNNLYFDSTTKCDSIKCDSTKFASIKCDSTKCDSIKCDSIKFDSTKCDSIKCDSIKCDSIKCDSKTSKTNLYPGRSMNMNESSTEGDNFNLNTNEMRKIPSCSDIIKMAMRAEQAFASSYFYANENM